MNGMITVAKKSNNLEFLKYAYSLGIRDFRLNMDYQKESYEAIENLHKLSKPDIRIFGDYQGVKMRIQLAENTNDISFNLGQLQTFYFNQTQFPYITNVDFFVKYICKGQQINIADGKICGNIIEKDENKIVVEFTKVDYVLRQNAGCFFIGDSIPSIKMTNKACLKIIKSKAIEEKLINWIILSFVSSAAEISSFVENIHKKGMKVMAKIETIHGIKNIEEISKLVDGFMIGRGDLKNTSEDKYFFYYSEALKKISSYKKEYSGVGTFFLSSYSDTKKLTDDERNDILNIKKMGLDYVMLSKEVVNSNYPYDTIKELQKLCQN